MDFRHFYNKTTNSALANSLAIFFFFNSFEFQPFSYYSTLIKEYEYPSFSI